MTKGILRKLHSDAASISHEVHDTLRELGHKTGWECMEVYYTLQYQFTVEEDWGIPGIYIVGRINADVSKIREVVERELESGTFDRAWDRLLESGVVEVTEEGIALPLLAGKLAVIAELEKVLDWQRRQFEKLEPAQDELLHDHDELRRSVAELKSTIEESLGVI